MLEHEKYLQTPHALCKPGYNNWNFGIIVEKMGGTSNEDRKEKILYLYSKTICRNSGKLVCTREWNDYNLGDWLYFNTMDDENFFNSEKVENPIPTTVRADNSVMVETSLFIVPNFFSNRNFSEKVKLWSPDMGLVYAEQSTLKKLQVRENRMYRCWISWAMTPICFSSMNTENTSSSEEPVIFWQLTQGNNEHVRDLGALSQYPKDVEDLRILGKHQTQLEVIIRFFRKLGKLPTKRETQILMPDDSAMDDPFRLIGKKAYGESISCGRNINSCFGIRDLKDIYVPPFRDFTVIVNVNNNSEKRSFIDSLQSTIAKSTSSYSRNEVSHHTIRTGAHMSPFSRRFDIELRFRNKQQDLMRKNSQSLSGFF